MPDAEPRPRPNPAMDLPAYDPEGLGVYLGRFPRNGAAQLRMLFWMAAACGIAITVIPVRSRAVAEATVHAVGRGHAIVAPITGSLTWFAAQPQDSMSGAEGREVDPGIRSPSSSPLAVRRGERIGEVVGPEASAIVVHVDGGAVPTPPPGSRVLILPMPGASPNGAVSGRVAAVDHGAESAARGAVGVHVVIEREAASGSTLASSPGLRAGQRVKMRIEAGPQPLWRMLGGRAHGRRGERAVGASSPLSAGW